MKTNKPALILLIIAWLSLSGNVQQQVSLCIELKPIPLSARFYNDSLSIWCGSVIKSNDGLYHLYYSAWPKNKGWAWVTHSTIMHAVARSRYGPYRFSDVVLPPRGADFWDGLCTHNPTIHKFGKKYYLYYMGNTGDGKNPNGYDKSMEKINWVHRNNQRIGVAVAASPYGPWKRSNQPLINIDTNANAMDALAVSNPAITKCPDGRYLMVYKAIARKKPLPFGGPVVHMAAFSSKPTGPFVKCKKAIFTIEGNDFPAEDPYIWYQAGKYRAIVKKMEHDATGKEDAMLVQYDSPNGIDWRPAKNFIISDKNITWANGRKQKLKHLERPQLLFDDDIPVTLICAADTLDNMGVRQTFSLQIPINVTQQID